MEGLQAFQKTVSHAWLIVSHLVTQLVRIGTLFEILVSWILLASIFYELTSLQSVILRMVGWAGFSAALALLVLTFPATPNSFEKIFSLQRGHRIALQLSLLGVIAAVLIGTWSRYKFQSPTLSFLQYYAAPILAKFQPAQYQSRPFMPHQKAAVDVNATSIKTVQQTELRCIVIEPPFDDDKHFVVNAKDSKEQCFRIHILDNRHHVTFILPTMWTRYEWSIVDGAEIPDCFEILQFPEDKNHIEGGDCSAYRSAPDAHITKIILGLSPGGYIDIFSLPS